MEKSNCLMLMMSLYTGIDLDAVFKEEDLRESGIEFDSHVTVFYDKGEKDFGDLKGDVQEILGPEESEKFFGDLKKGLQYKILDLFELSSFESGVIVLKLKTTSEIFKVLQKINSGLTEKYGLKSDFSEYVPHLTLAYIEPQKIQDYLENPVLKKVLELGYIRIDDLLMSYGWTDDVQDDYNYVAITNYHTLERHFRLENLKK